MALILIAPKQANSTGLDHLKSFVVLLRQCSVFMELKVRQLLVGGVPIVHTFH